jgi:hypothetical protein
LIPDRGGLLCPIVPEHADGRWRYVRNEPVNLPSNGWWQTHGFAATSRTSTAGGGRTSIVRALHAPYWGIVLVSGVVPALWLHDTRRRARRRRTCHCPRCGYDLRATPERCPECGAAAS